MDFTLCEIVSDITSATGMRIVRGIMAGERNPALLAAHRDCRCHASVGEISAALAGKCREEHVFAPAQADRYNLYQAKVAESEARIEQVLEPLAPGLIHNSDRGIQYAAQANRLVLAGYRIIPSMSGEGNRLDNEPMESFFRTLKSSGFTTTSTPLVPKRNAICSSISRASTVHVACTRPWAISFPPMPRKSRPNPVHFFEENISGGCLDFVESAPISDNSRRSCRATGKARASAPTLPKGTQSQAR